MTTETAPAPELAARAAPRSHDPRVEAAARALGPLLRALGDRRDFAIRFWDGRGIRAATKRPRFTLVIRRPGALRRMLLPPTDLAIGEAFVHGDFDVKGDIFAFVSLADRFADLRLSPIDWVRMAVRLRALADDDAPTSGGRSAATLTGQRHSAQRDRDAIRFHYDVGNDFYGLWLGERMVYSCAYFARPEMSLDEAQEAKLDLVLDKLGLRDGMRLLDIGCGWGGLLLRAAERFPTVEAIGITLSERQHALAGERIADAGVADRIRVELMDYRDAPAALGRFDRIASIGMAEHVGRQRMPDYFGGAAASLAPGGLFLNHLITAQPRRTLRPSLLIGRIPLARVARSFIDAYVFPDGELLSLADSLAVAQSSGFEVRDVESMRPHYAATLRHWVAGLEEQWDAAVAASGEAVARTWRLYLAGAAIGFESARLDVHQELLALPRADGSSDAPPIRTWS
jgi:cyclopropane-fatty-acyl-phospholipid synthase